MTEPFRKRMAKAAERSPVVLALDPPVDRKNLKQFAVKTVEAVAEHVCAVKINFHLLLPLSARETSEITGLGHSHGLQCIADIKLNDIEHTNEIALHHLVRMGFDAVIANPFMGSGELDELVQKAHEMDAGVIALVYMSHPGAKEGYGLKLNSKSLYHVFLDRALRADADGIVVGATQTEIMKQVMRKKKRQGFSLPVYSPGVGAQGGDIAKAIKSGSDYLIVGRSIVEADDPARAAREIQAKALSCR